MAGGFRLRSPGGGRSFWWQATSQVAVKSCFYKQLIAKADKRFTAHCERLAQEEKQRKQQD